MKKASENKHPDSCKHAISVETFIKGLKKKVASPHPLFSVTKWIIALLLFLTVVLTPLKSESAAIHVLPENAADQISESFHSLMPEISIKNVTIKHSVVEATLCNTRHENDSFKLKLNYPGDDCRGVVTGYWCLVFEGPVPPAKVQIQIINLLSDTGSRSPWLTSNAGESDSEPAGKVEAEQADQQANLDKNDNAFPDANQPQEENENLFYYLAAIIITLIPFLIGLVLVYLVAPILNNKSKVKIPASIGYFLVFLVPLGVIAFLPLGFWDVIVSVMMVWLGVWRGLLSVRKEAGPGLDMAVLIVIGISLALLELGARILFPPPPVFPDIKDASILKAGVFTYDEAACEILFPDVYPEVYEERTAAASPEKKIVFHLGDSMLYWWGGVRPEDSTVGILNQLDKRATHVSAAVPGTGPGFHLLVARRWLKRLDPDLVVIHICLTNDIVELDRPWPCCKELPLLIKTPEGPKARCDKPVYGKRWEYPFQQEIYKSPPPYAVRIATDFSVFARHLGSIFERISKLASRRDVGTIYPNTTESLVLLIQALQADLKLRNIPLIVVLTPFRDSLDPQHPMMEDQNAKMMATQKRIEELSIPVLNAYWPFSQAARNKPIESFFLNSFPFDIHLSAEGHNLEAHWLYENLYEAAGLSDLAPSRNQ